MQALAFILYSPLQSWGDIAVGEIRNSLNYPTKSALIGFISAALGYDRIDDEAKILELNSTLKFAIRLDGDRKVISDYHTTQVPSSKKGVTHRSRASELAMPELNTILSTREYLCDAVFSVFCFGESELLILLLDKLTSPERALYLGRKSCPLAISCMPKILVGESLAEIQAQYFLAPEIREKWVPQKKSGEEVRIYWEDGISSGLQSIAIFTKHDNIISRARWQFGVRNEYMASVMMP
jgi:CRISPR system Cascade subunit CasD